MASFRPYRASLANISTDMELMPLIPPRDSVGKWDGGYDLQQKRMMERLSVDCRKLALVKKVNLWNFPKISCYSSGNLRDENRSQ